MFVSIDPGLNHIGFAVWMRSKTLIAAGLARNPLARSKGVARPEIWCGASSALLRRVMEVDTAPMGEETAESIGLIVEIPVVRQRGSGKGDPNDLIDVAGVAACCVQAFKLQVGAHVAWSPKPEEWKGQLPKEVTEHRVMNKLSEDEKARIEPVNRGVIHNVYDAIHMGLVHLKRA